MVEMSLEEFRQAVIGSAETVLADRGYILSGFQIIDDDESVVFGTTLAVERTSIKICE